MDIFAFGRPLFWILSWTKREMIHSSTRSSTKKIFNLHNDALSLVDCMCTWSRPPLVSRARHLPELYTLPSPCTTLRCKLVWHNGTQAQWFVKPQSDIVPRGLCWHLRVFITARMLFIWKYSPLESFVPLLRARSLVLLSNRASLAKQLSCYKH